MIIEIDYDGKYPNLCSGKLVVTIDGTKWEFPEHCLSSNGSAWFDGEWSEQVESEGWSILYWPDGFPEELKSIVKDAVNNSTEHGCCGGCV